MKVALRSRETHLFKCLMPKMIQHGRMILKCFSEEAKWHRFNMAHKNSVQLKIQSSDLSKGSFFNYFLEASASLPFHRWVRGKKRAWKRRGFRLSTAQQSGKLISQFVSE